jgi:16S rRNA processing protein RimM
MNLINIGKIVNTHGIKGEVRIISNFKFKDKVFKKGFNLYIGVNKQQLIINSYRVHKNYDMITFLDIVNINDVLQYKGSNVYVNKDDIALDNNNYLDEDIIGLNVYIDNKYIGIITYILKIPNNEVLEIMDNNKKILIPYNKALIKEIDIVNKKVIIDNIEGLI